MTIRYEAFGYLIDSEIPLPELKPIHRLDIHADICIRRSSLEDEWRDVTHTAPNVHYYVNEDRFMFRVPGVAIYAVEDGSHIRIDPHIEAHADQVRIYILGTCMGALLLQKRVLPLHGSAVVIDHKAYAIVGDSGAGKSTLAASFAEAGYQLLTDDVIAVRWDEEHRIPIVVPAYPQQKLWKESMERIGISSDRSKPLYHEANKYAVQIDSKFCTEPYPLAGIFELSWYEEKEVQITPLTSLHTLPLLRQHTYRHFLIPNMRLSQWHFTLISRLASMVAVYRIRRPQGIFTASQLVTEIQKITSERSNQHAERDKTG